MENKVRAIKRPVYFTISLIAFPFCLPCLPPDGAVQNTYTPIAHVCFRLFLMHAYTYLSLLILATVHTHVHTQHFTQRDVHRGKKYIGTIDGNPCNIASFGCLSSYRKFRNAVSGYRSSTSSLMDRINHGDIQATRRAGGEDFVIDGNFCSLHFLGIINTRMFVNSVCLSNIYFVNGEIVILFAKGNDRYRQPSTTYMYNKRANTHPINWLGIRKLVL